ERHVHSQGTNAARRAEARRPLSAARHWLEDGDDACRHLSDVQDALFRTGTLVRVVKRLATGGANEDIRITRDVDLHLHHRRVRGWRIMYFRVPLFRLRPRSSLVALPATCREEK
ncbi:MAG: hypothetical protein Q9157_008225, partial [Trypethelium eluteriae]